MAAEKTKKITRGADRKLMGVCSGLAEYFGIDVVIVRLLWIVVTVFTGGVPGIITYFLAAWVMPEK